MRKILAVTAIAGTLFAGVGIGAGVASASGTTISTVNQTTSISSANCYKTHRVTITTYHWSKKTGWTRYAAPKKTVTDSTTCH
jgi:hypothetical protein